MTSNDLGGVFFCVQTFCCTKFVEILKISDPSRYSFTNKKNPVDFACLGGQAPILGIALMLFNCTLSSLLRDVNCKRRGTLEWLDAVQPFQSYSCSEHVSYCRFFWTPRWIPSFLAFPRLFHCRIWCHLGTWWGWAVSWRRWPWNIAPARTWRSSLRICSVV